MYEQAIIETLIELSRQERQAWREAHERVQRQNTGDEWQREIREGSRS